MSGRTFDNDTGAEVNAAPHPNKPPGDLGDLPPIPNWLNWGLVIVFTYHVFKGFFKGER